MPPRSKKPMNESDKEQFLATMVVKAAHNFDYLTLDDIGIPPLSAGKETCTGHSKRDFCVICRFNLCQGCGVPLSHLSRLGRFALWSGACGGGACGAGSSDHHARVLLLVNAEMGVEDNDVPDLDDGWLDGGGVQSFRPRIQISKAPKARKALAKAPVKAVAPKAPALAAAAPVIVPVVAPAAVPAIAPVIAPQINIAIAPLAALSVESVQTSVRRTADGPAGGARFEVTVTVVLEQQ